MIQFDNVRQTRFTRIAARTDIIERRLRQRRDILFSNADITQMQRNSHIAI